MLNEGRWPDQELGWGLSGPQMEGNKPQGWRWWPHQQLGRLGWLGRPGNQLGSLEHMLWPEVSAADQTRIQKRSAGAQR